VRPLPDLSIRQLEYLVAVADSPSWAIAAERVGVSASALSQGLAELERRLGVPLFERDGRRRRVRPSAQPAVSHARQVLGLTGDLADWANRINRGVAGRLRLGMIDAAAIGHHSEVVRAFRDEHPDIDLRLRVAPSAPLLDLLISGELDLVVCVEPSESIAGIDTEPVLTEQLAVYGPPDGDLDRPSTWGPWVLFPAGSTLAPSSPTRSRGSARRSRSPPRATNPTSSARWSASDRAGPCCRSSRPSTGIERSPRGDR